MASALSVTNGDSLEGQDATPLTTQGLKLVSVTNGDSLEGKDAPPLTTQGLKLETAAATDGCNTPFPPPLGNNSPAYPSDDKPPIPSSDNGPVSSTGPPPPPSDDEPPPPTPAADTSYINVSTPQSSTKRRVIESYEYVNNKRVTNPSSPYAHPLTGPGYGIVGNSKILTSGDGYAYVSNRDIPLDKGGRGGEGCPQCTQYQQQLDQWQQNSSDLASSYSKILAQLNMAQTILMRLEDTIKDELVIHLPPPPSSSFSTNTFTSSDLELQSAGAPRGSRRTQTVTGRGSTGSLNGNNGSNATVGPDKTMVTDMYPETEDHYPLSPQCHSQLTSLAFHLSRAMDICQSSAAALFKRGRLARSTNVTVHAHSPSSSRRKAPFVRVSTQPAWSMEGGASSKANPPSYTSNLASVKESSLTMESANGESSLHSLSRVGAVKKCCSSDDVSGRNSCSKSSVEGPVVVETSPEEKVLSRGEQKEGGEVEHKGVGQGNDQEVSMDKLKDRSVDKDGSGSNLGPSSVQSCQAGDQVTGPTNLDKEPFKKPYVSHMMSLMMEDPQGFCMVDYPEEGKDVADIGEENQTPDVAVDDKDFKQAMSKIADMEEGRRNLLEELETLQQDNQQVRISLSDALNALENRELQLMLAMQDLAIATHEMKKAAEIRAELQKVKFDRDQILESFRTLEDDHAAVKYSLLQQLQQRPNSRAEASPDFLTHGMEGTSSEIEDKDTVYKQGFLVKQGGLVKSWKKRLFVLDCEGLSYYKTDQPVQVVTLSKISKVEHARDNAQHKFDVYTSDRVFRLMAPSHKEMQSWVGILQTLKDHHRAAAMAKSNGRPMSHLGVNKPCKALSLDSQDLDQNIFPLKATTLPTITTSNSSGAISGKLPLSFQQLRAKDEKEQGDLRTTMSFSLPASNHLADEQSPSDVTAEFFGSSGNDL